MKADQMIYFMLRDAYPERPMYFSRTAGSYPYELGLERYVVTQGLAKKLMPNPVVPSANIIMVPGEGLMDVERSKELWSSVFKAPTSLSKRNGWVDDASVGIPDLYVITGVTIAEGLASTGKAAASDSLYQQSRAIATAMRRDRVFGFDRQPTLQLPPTADTAATPTLPVTPPAKK
jgi:hypothetical protein